MFVRGLRPYTIFALKHNIDTQFVKLFSGNVWCYQGWQEYSPDDFPSNPDDYVILLHSPSN